MKAKLLTLILLASGCLFAGPRVSFGVGFSPAYGSYDYAPPPPVYAYAPPTVAYPEAGYVPINGYYRYGPSGYYWQRGYYARPPYGGAFWVGPRYYSGRYYGGYWGRRR